MTRVDVANAGQLQIVPDADLSAASVKEIVSCAERAITERGQFTIALCGGNTPRGPYSLLAERYRDSLPWTKVQIFFGDDRHVPPDDPQSNYRLANETLLSKIPIPAANVHRVRAELPAETAAEKYEQELRHFFHLREGEWPRFDFILLGIGENGHTASLFPGTVALKERSRLVVGNWVEELHTWRITFTYPTINHAGEVLFMISGSNKAEVLKEILDRSGRYPAEGVQPENGRLLWIVDQSAARLL